MKAIQAMIQQLFGTFSVAEILGFIAIVLIAIWVITIIFRTAGMISTLEQVVSTVIQQTCSILITGFQLSLRLFQAVQLYLILLLDILTGKSTSEQKVCVLASSALSIASFYTTYQGFCYIISIKTIAILLTIGIQTLMLRTSLQLGMQMDWDGKIPGDFRWVFYGGVSLFITVTIGYVLNKINLLDFNRLKLVNYIISYVCVLLVLAIFFSFIYSISHLRMKNKQTALYLFTIYFATLAVSSFFSFHAFFISLYPTNLRMLDNFTEAKQSVIVEMEQINNQVDDKYYFQLSNEIQTLLNTFKDKMGTDNSTEIEKLKKEMEPFDDSYILYMDAMEEIAKAEEEIRRLNNQLAIDKANILDKEGDTVGYNTRTLVESLEANNRILVNEQRGIIANQNEILQDNIFKMQPAILKNYESNQKDLENLTNKSEISDKFSKASLLLAKDEWEQDDIDGFSSILNDIQNEIEDVNLVNLSSVLGEYKQYRKIYREEAKNISGLHLNEQSGEVSTEYQNKRAELFEGIYNIVNAVPRKDISFMIDGEYKTPYIVNLDVIVVALEQYYADSNMERHIFQQNISSFWKARVPAFLSLLIAVMVDNLILFVGLVSPKKLEFFNHIPDEESDKKKMILEHFFSKPVKKV